MGDFLELLKKPSNNMMVNEFFLAITAPIVAATGAVLIARRSSSGKIATSDASDLWAESQSIRRELRDRVVVLEAKVADLETAREKDRQQIADLKVELIVLNAQLKDLS